MTLNPVRGMSGRLLPVWAMYKDTASLEPRCRVLATSLFGDAAAALREHRSAALDEHCWSCAALTES